MNTCVFIWCIGATVTMPLVGWLIILGTELGAALGKLSKEKGE